MWFLCVSVDGDDVRAELSKAPGVAGGNFKPFDERIFILRKGEWEKICVIGGDDFSRTRSSLSRPCVASRTMLNTTRLEIARQRRRLTARRDQRAGISPSDASRIIRKLQKPDYDTVEALIEALEYPRAFFLDDVDNVDVQAVSFRSLTTMTARERDAALSAGILAFEFLDWVKGRFDLPVPDL